MEEAFSFTSGKFKLAGLIDKTDSAKGAVITHPHPLYGGDMYNPVVETLKIVYGQKGYTTLRFDFRGNGDSEGIYDNGQGEQLDVCSAVKNLMDLGIRQIELAGYSFGAWVNALTVQQEIPIKHLIMVSPPVGFIDFQGVRTIPGLQLVVTGSRDEIAPVKRIEQLLPSWNPAASLKVISGADHFYGGYIDQLESVLAANIAVS